METLIDKVKFLESNTNIPTVGFKTLLAVLKNSSAGAASSDYAGTASEAAALKAGITIKMSDSSDGSNPVVLDDQYYNVRTQEGTDHAFLEIILTQAYIASITLPADITILAGLLTLPANSQVPQQG